jgi:hypothetical protein
VSVDLVIQHIKRMRRIVLSSWPGWHCHIFPHYLLNDTIFEKKVLEHKMCVLIFSTNFVWNYIYSPTNVQFNHINCVTLSYMFRNLNSGSSSGTINIEIKCTEWITFSLSGTFLILRGIQRGTVRNVIGLLILRWIHKCKRSSCKVPVILVRF